MTKALAYAAPFGSRTVPETFGVGNWMSLVTTDPDVTVTMEFESGGVMVSLAGL